MLLGVGYKVWPFLRFCVCVRMVTVRKAIHTLAVLFEKCGQEVFTHI